tara:strand:+ start:110 stop:406 length:297 start_codon:yes stop_codon:yes gene_type:complete
MDYFPDNEAADESALDYDQYEVVYADSEADSPSLSCRVPEQVQAASTEEQQGQSRDGYRTERVSMDEEVAEILQYAAGELREQEVNTVIEAFRWLKWV